jgi:lipopolysaccharide export system ATP-binding protein
MLFRAENLTKSFDLRTVVNGVNLKVESGEIIGLLGRNGAGKTTTFQMMVGLLHPDKGSLYMDDRNISRDSIHQRAEAGIIYLPQENSVFLKTTVENNLKMILQLQDLNNEDIEQKTHSLLEELGLMPQSKQSAFTLSGGERRKLEICRALTVNPTFLLLDEPFTGIDPITIIELQKIILKLRDDGIGIIISDHNVRDTFKITSRAYILDGGKILIEGPPKIIASDENAKSCFLGKDFRLGEEIQNYSFREKR